MSKGPQPGWPCIRSRQDKKNELKDMPARSGDVEPERKKPQETETHSTVTPKLSPSCAVGALEKK